MHARLDTTVVVAASAAVALALSLFRLHDDDVGFHVANGRLVREAWRTGGEIPTANPFSYAVPGHPWTQHQWLPAAATAWLVDDAPDRLGIRGVPAATGGPGQADGPERPDARVLVALKAALFALLFGLLAWGALAEGCPPALAFAMCSLGAAAASPRFYERPYLLSSLGLAATVLALRAWGRAAPGSRRRSAWLAVAVAVPVANAHLHAGVWDSLLTWVAVVGGTAASWAVARARGRDAPSPMPLLAGLGATAALVIGSLAAFAPAGVEVLLLPLRMTDSAYWAKHLKEFRPLWDAIVPLWPAVAFVIVTAALLAWRRREVDLGGHFVVWGFAVLAVRHQRMILPFVVAGLPVIGRAVAGIRVPRTLAAGAVAIGVAMAGAAWGMQSERFRMGLGDAGDGGIDASAHPFALLDRIDRDGLPGEVFTSDGFAGTFLWRLYPSRRVLVHTDLEAYPVEAFEDPYQVIRYAREGFEDRLRALGVRTFLLKHTTSGERAAAAGRPNLRDVLWERTGTGSFPDAVLVDFDDAGALWVLRDALPAEVATLDGFPVNPDTGRPRASAQPEAARDALVAHAKAHPGSVRSLRILRALFPARE